MKKFFSPEPVWGSNGVALVRMIIGISLVYHGCEMFDTTAMNEYLTWDLFKNGSSGRIFVYSGKVFELLAGLLLFLGLFTRLACLIVICTLGYIAFGVGHGKIWYDDQYPFLFVLFGITFLFTGPGSFSLDRLIFKSKT